MELFMAVEREEREEIDASSSEDGEMRRGREIDASSSEDGDVPHSKVFEMPFVVRSRVDHGDVTCSEQVCVGPAIGHR